MLFPAALEILPLTQAPVATIRVPGSKSITNRALVLAALNSGGWGFGLYGALRSEDTQMMVQGLQALGFPVQAEDRLRDLSDHPSNWGYVRIGRRPDRMTPKADLFAGNSGTTMRFLTAVACLGEGRYRLDGVPRMRERPIGDLLDALRRLNVRASAERCAGCPPVVIDANGLGGGRVRIKGDVSSQFLSALLLVASRARADVRITVDGALVSEPYVAMTLAMLRQFRLRVEVLGGRRFHVRAPQVGLCNGPYRIEPDASAASYFFAAAAITGGRVTVPGLSTDSLQGDVRFIDVLERMGCTVERAADQLTVQGGPLHGIDVDMNAVSDTVMTLAAVACFADGPTTIRNVAHIRHKESDRLHALATELRRLGARVEERPDGLTITPNALRGAEVETYADHRLAMSLALIGLRVPGVVVRNPGCVAKTYPDFFRDLARLYEIESPHWEFVDRAERPS